MAGRELSTTRMTSDEVVPQSDRKDLWDPSADEQHVFWSPGMLLKMC